MEKVLISSRFFIEKLKQTGPQMRSLYQKIVRFDTKDNILSNIHPTYKSTKLKPLQSTSVDVGQA